MYQPYRGVRAQRRRMIRNVLIVLLSLFILACIVFLLFFQNKDSINFFGKQIDLPWISSQNAGPKQDEQDMNFEIKDDGQADGGAAPDTQQPATTPAAAGAAKTIEIPADRLADPAYLAQVTQLAGKGMNTAAIVVKDADGIITGSAVLTPAIAALHDAGMKVSAIVYAYEDNIYAKQTTAAALKNVSGKSWRMPDGARWLDPASDEALSYLTAKVQACKAAGVDEIILRGFGWPAEGNIGRIQYGSYAAAAQRADLLAQRLTALASAASPVPVSVVVDAPTAPNGLSEASGQDVAKLYAAAAKLYLPMAVQTETSGDSIRTIVGGFTNGDTAKLVPMYTSAALFPNLLAGSNAVYLVPSETSGDLAALLA